MNAYVTVLTGGSYEEGVLGLWGSLQRMHSAYPLVVLISDNVSREVIDRLKKLMEVKVLNDDIQISEETKAKNKGFFEKWNRTFFKLKVASLIEYSKIVLLDADMVIKKNIDHLFECPHMSCVYAETLRGGVIRLNSGLMVIEPSLQLYEELLDAIIPVQLKFPDAPIGDQDVFKYVYSDWPEHDELHLPPVYNCYHSDIDEFVRRGYFGYEDIFVIHYTLTKPWTVKTVTCYKQLILSLLGRGNVNYLALSNLAYKKDYKIAIKHLQRNP